MKGIGRRYIHHLLFCVAIYTIFFVCALLCGENLGSEIVPRGEESWLRVIQEAPPSIVRDE